MVHNVVIFGESGGGKSSTINIILGKTVANVSDKAVGCTFEFQRYEADDGQYVLFDTVGLSEGKKGTVDQAFAVQQLIELLKSLEGGVSLLVFVMEKSRIKKSLDENYKLFVEAICMKKVPVMLMITHCEMEEVVGTWWNENKLYFDKYGMKFTEVVSGCCMTPSSAPVMIRERVASMNKATEEKLKIGILRHMLSPGWKVKGGWKSWFQSILTSVFSITARFFGFTYAAAEPGFKQRLVTYFKDAGYDDAAANKMAYDISKAA